MEIKDILNSNINNNFSKNEIKPFSNINTPNNKEVLNIKSIINKNNNKESKRALFTQSEKELLLKLIPNKCLDNYENKYNSIMKENLSLQNQINNKIRLKTITKQHNLIKLEKSELINNIIQKKKLKLDTQKNTANKKIYELKEKIKHNKKLLMYYNAAYNQKKKENNILLDKYKKIYNDIKNGKLYLKKGAQLTQDNIIAMDIYGKKEGDNTTSFNEVNDYEDNGKISEYSDNNWINEENEIENENNEDNEEEEENE